MPIGVYERSNKKERALMYAVIDFFLEHHRFPTIRECIEISPYASTSAVSYSLSRLAKKGKLASRSVGKMTFYKIVGLIVKPPDWYTEVKNEGYVDAHS